jgi:hypothetical protein
MQVGIALGAGLATGLVALTGWQLARAEFAVALIAAGMAAMAIGMAFPIGHLVQGPWWAAAFALIGIWAWRSASPASPSTQLQHLVGGLAMVYMCAAWPGSAGLATPAAGAALNADAHHLAVGPAASSAVTAAGAQQVGLALPLVGWLLACYFLLHAIGALTRRRRAPDAVATGAGRAAVVRDAVMGVGMTAMLLVMI